MLKKINILFLLQACGLIALNGGEYVIAQVGMGGIGGEF